MCAGEQAGLALSPAQKGRRPSRQPTVELDLHASLDSLALTQELATMRSDVNGATTHVQPPPLPTAAALEAHAALPKERLAPNGEILTQPRVKEQVFAAPLTLEFSSNP